MVVTTTAPIAKIEKIEIQEYTSKKTYSVTHGGSVNVGEERIRITVTVRNVGAVSGTIVTELLVDGVSKGPRSLSLSPYVSGSTYWDIELTQGSHSVIVRAGHELYI